MPRDFNTKLSLWKTLRLTAAISILFATIYGGCNWITSLRSDVGVVQFDWERRLPVVPLLIVPYISIDFLFLMSPFVCRTRRELETLAKRLVAATILAGICFLLFPLTLADARPEFTGVLGAIYDLLKAGDRPFNLYPSLHVTFLLLLWPPYHRHTRGAIRTVLHGWFAIVLISVLFVRQHHVVDIVGGAILATACLYIFPDLGRGLTLNRRDFQRRPEIAWRYGIGAVLMFVLAFFIGGWGAIAAWIGMSLSVMSCAYAFAGPVVYRKVNGVIPISARVLLAPHMLGVYVTRLCWFRSTATPLQRITGGVWLGRFFRDRETKQVADLPAAAVLDVTAEHGEALQFRKLKYCNIQVLDMTLPTPGQLRDAAIFIQRQHCNGGVYVHCALGRTRSVAAVAAFLLSSGNAKNVEQAFAIIRAARPEVVINPAMIAALESFHHTMPTRHHDNSMGHLGSGTII